MKTDRELLELAANAAGIEYDKTCTENDYRFGLWLTIHGEPYERQRRKWNPLTDDGDALRLAVILGIDVMIGDGVKFVATRCRTTYSINEYTYAQDKYTAIRRAIVRAAVAIGEQT